MMDRTHDVAVVRFVARSSWRRGSKRRGRATVRPWGGRCHRSAIISCSWPMKDLSRRCKAKGNASDLVQETFLQAQRGVQSFRGRTASEWRHWLRKILIRNMAQERRRFAATAKRQVQREVAIPDEMQLEYARLHRDSQPRSGAARARGGLDRGTGTPAGPLSGGRHLASSGAALVRGDRPAVRDQRRGGPQALDAGAGSLTEGTWSSP